ncbi:prevent-host-death family protein [Cyclonatronum proteinivorum]|uniref:Antitoxin n=1 Tax=Cyclonatronum proteinivorum TaxID=1457365 RepID=A0A345UH36_9BACT|nr:type II toxin-antitoxin system Phd/YefM family antitoxin [Cyclonatronum proteinivorum]AXI99787.1 prevent-host-death family protein [Cyclonatronum proteinivorum]
MSSAARIDKEQDIQPLSAFRKNATDFIEKIKSEKRSIVLTQNGKRVAVLVEASEYQRMQDKLAMMEDLIEAERQIARGEIVPHDEAKKQIPENLARWK